MSIFQLFECLNSSNITGAIQIVFLASISSGEKVKHDPMSTRMREACPLITLLLAWDATGKSSDLVWWCLVNVGSQKEYLWWGTQSVHHGPLGSRFEEATASLCHLKCKASQVPPTASEESSDTKRGVMTRTVCQPLRLDKLQLEG